MSNDDNKTGIGAKVGAKAASAWKSVKNILTPELKRQAKQIGSQAEANLSKAIDVGLRQSQQQQTDIAPGATQKAQKVLGVAAKDSPKATKILGIRGKGGGDRGM